MKQFIKRFFLFLIPVILYIILALYIDPYSIIFEEKNKDFIEKKIEISYKINYPLYKLNQYAKKPTDVILLGDSRTDKLNTQTFNKLLQKKTTNLAYGGGSLNEIIKTFWYATKIHSLKEVYVGLNFNLYNKTNNIDRVTEAIELNNYPISYIFSQYCFKSTFLISKSLLTNKKIEIEKPTLNEEAFWNYQLESSANNFYRTYSYPENYYNSLQEISNYCIKNNIKLIFFIPPTHLDLQDKVKEFKLEQAQQTFINDLTNFGTVYNFDFKNELTLNKSNFTDPFHYNDSIANLVIKDIVTGQTRFAKINSKK